MQIQATPVTNGLVYLQEYPDLPVQRHKHRQGVLPFSNKAACHPPLSIRRTTAHDLSGEPAKQGRAIEISCCGVCLASQSAFYSILRLREADRASTLNNHQPAKERADVDAASDMLVLVSL